MSAFTFEEEQKLAQLAGQLFGGAKLQASMLYPALISQFPLMVEIEPDRWAFIYAVVAVYIAAEKLDQPAFANDLGERLWDIVAKRLTEDRPVLPAVIQECRKHCLRVGNRLKTLEYYQDNPGDLIPDIVGSFMMKFLFGQDALSQTERHMARSIGSLMVDRYEGYWTPCPESLN